MPKSISFRRSSLQDNIAKVVTAISILATLALFFAPSKWAYPLAVNWPFNLLRLAIILCAIIFGSSLLLQYNLTSSKNSSSPLYPKLAIILPLIVIVCIILQIAFPQFASDLIRKETWPFYRSGIFIKCGMELVGAALCCYMVLINRKKHQPTVVLCLLLAIVLFLMAGEELSWGQRIFNWKTPELIATYNIQKETNFHNLATQLFQNTLYFGGWILLILLPLLSSSLAKWFRNHRLSYIVDFLPPQQFTLIFAPVFMLSDPLLADYQAASGVYYNSNLFIILGTIAAIIIILHSQLKQKQNWQQPALILALSIIVAVNSLFLNHIWDYNHGTPTEYLELFIDFGIMLWVITLFCRTRQNLRAAH